jgi:flagella basal body P-ring formation protein FlgA
MMAVQSRQAAQRAEQAIVGHLQATVGKAAWEVKVEPDSAAVPLLAARLSDVSVEGGREPWTGKQDFVMLVKADDGVERVSVRAQVALPEAIVVAARALRRGEAIRAADVRLAPAAVPVGGFEAIGRLEDVVGKESVRSLAEGQPIDGRELQSPRLVRRRDRVAVFARGQGVRVRTTALALEDGGLGDLVEVESTVYRKRFMARVTGAQEVEVYARGPSVARTQTASQSARR